MTAEQAVRSPRAGMPRFFRLLERARSLALGVREAGQPSDGSDRLADFLRAAADFLWESDGELRLVWLSATATSVLGRPAGELVGRRWAELAVEPANGALESADPVAGGEGFVPGRPFRDRRVSLLGGDGRLRILETSAVPLVDRNGRLRGYRGIAREVGERVRAEQRLRFLAAHDPLTGAANRLSLASALAAAIERAARGGHRVGLVMVDLDGFKQVNDALGHGAGDGVLRTVVRRLRDGLAAGDVVARLGGDEFALLLAEIGRSEDPTARLEALAQRLAEPIPVAAATVVLGASCGFALWPDHGRGLDELLARADQQMYRIKRARRGRLLEPHRQCEGAPAVG